MLASVVLLVVVPQPLASAKMEQTAMMNTTRVKVTVHLHHRRMNTSIHAMQLLLLQWLAT